MAMRILPVTSNNILQANTATSMIRNNAIDILKGIGILLVVIGHSGCPSTLRILIYMIHMPLFFLASGYFLNVERFADTHNYIKGKIKSLYLPFQKYALTFLFFHNLLIDLGVMTTEYGARYYNFTTTLTELMLRCVFMEVHDEALLGTYWFVQTLFFSHILLAITYSMLLRKRIKSTGKISFLTFLTFAFLISYAHYLCPNIKTVCLYRICMGVVFIWIGHILRKKTYKNRHILLTFIVFVITFIIHPASMKEQSDMYDCVSLLISGSCGFILLLRLSQCIDKIRGYFLSKISLLLSYIGKQSFYIMTFHFLSFKAVSLLVILYYGWDDFSLIGMHPCITSVSETYWWIVYSVAGIILSLAIHSTITFIANSICIKIRN